MKKLIALLLCFTLFCTLFPAVAHAAAEHDALVTELLLSRQNDYPEGDECKPSTPRYHVTIRSPGVIFQCDSCWGFAFVFLGDVFNINLKKTIPLTWQSVQADVSKRPGFEEPYTSAADLRPADILAWQHPGHAAVVLETHPERRTVTIVEGGYGGTVHWGREVSFDALDRSLAYIIRLHSSLLPDFDAGQEPPAKQTQPGTFEDVSESSWYSRSVQWAVQHGITTGTGKNRFSPDAPCTRKQAMTFLWRACGAPDTAETATCFADVEPSAYYSRAVAWGLSKSITCGTGPNAFGGDAACTRAQIVTFLWRMAGSPAPADGGNTFTDVPASAYYASPVQWAVEYGITCGKDAAHFCPDDICTRAEIVCFLHKALGSH